MEKEELASKIDHTLLKPGTSLDDIRLLCAKALKYRFCAVCVSPTWVKDAHGLLSHSSVKVAAVIGFPHGNSSTTAKVSEATQAINDGAHELDMVANLDCLCSGDYDAVQDDIAHVVAAAKKINPKLS